MAEDRWRVWRVTEPEPEYLRSMTRRRGPRRPGPVPHRVRWWSVTRSAVPPFETFLEETGPMVMRFLLVAVGPTDADDVFQDSFLAALRAYPRCDESAAPRPLGAEDRLTQGDRPPPRHGPPADADRRAARTSRPAARPRSTTSLWAEVAALPPKQRVAVVHRHVLDRPYAEIASSSWARRRRRPAPTWPPGCAASGGGCGERARPPPPRVPRDGRRTRPRRVRARAGACARRRPGRRRGRPRRRAGRGAPGRRHGPRARVRRLRRRGPGGARRAVRGRAVAADRPLSARDRRGAPRADRVLRRHPDRVRAERRPTAHAPVRSQGPGRHVARGVRRAGHVRADRDADRPSLGGAGGGRGPRIEPRSRSSSRATGSSERAAGSPATLAGSIARKSCSSSRGRSPRGWSR